MAHEWVTDSEGRAGHDALIQETNATRAAIIHCEEMIDKMGLCSLHEDEQNGEAHKQYLHYQSIKQELNRRL